MAGDLSNGGPDERRPSQVEPAPLGHQQLIAQHRQIAAAGHAIAEDRRDLRHAGGGQDGVVAEDAAEVVLIGEDLVLQRQKYAGRVHEVKQRQAIVEGDALGPKDLFDGQREEGAGLDGGVIGHNHRLPAGDSADAGDDARGGSAAPFLIHLPGGPQAQLEERALRVDQPGDALPRGQAFFFVLAVDRVGAAALLNTFFLRADLGNEAGKRGDVGHVQAISSVMICSRVYGHSAGKVVAGIRVSTAARFTAPWYTLARSSSAWRRSVALSRRPSSSKR